MSVLMMSQNTSRRNHAAISHLLAWSIIKRSCLATFILAVDLACTLAIIIFVQLFLFIQPDNFVDLSYWICF